MTQAQTNDLTTNALALAAIGAQACPARQDKAPATPNGFHAGTTDQTKIRQMFRAPEAAYPAIWIEGDYLVIDLDVDMDTGEKTGEQHFGKWVHSDEAMAAAVIVNTPSGGKHLWYKATPAIKGRYQSGEFYHKIDVLAAGGVNFYGSDPSILANVQDCPVADELMATITARVNDRDTAQVGCPDRVVRFDC